MTIPAEGKKIMVGPTCPWPLRCTVNNMICGSPEWRASMLCTCVHCTAFRHFYPGARQARG